MLSHHSLGFLCFHRGHVASQLYALTVGDAVLGYSSTLVALTVWHPASSPLHNLTFVSVTSARAYRPFLPHQDTVPPSITYLATVPVGPLPVSP